MVARVIRLTCTKHTHIPTVVKRMPSVLKLRYFTGWPHRVQYVKPGNAVTKITSRVCFIHSEWKYKEWCEVWWVITTLAAHSRSVFNQSNYAQVYGDEWIVVWILRNCGDEPITQHGEVCSSLHFVDSEVSLGTNALHCPWPHEPGTYPSNVFLQSFFWQYSPICA